jgi:hypothetical protein
VTGNARATLFENPGFLGESYVVDSDIPSVAQLRSNELRSWQRVAGSIRSKDAVFSDPGQSAESRVCVYSQSNFGGQSICFNNGEDSPDLRRARGWWNGRIGSVRLFGNSQVTIYESPSLAVLRTSSPPMCRISHAYAVVNCETGAAKSRVFGSMGGGHPQA